MEYVAALIVGLAAAQACAALLVGVGVVLLRAMR
jgi:hypothetical protein